MDNSQEIPAKFNIPHQTEPLLLKVCGTRDFQNIHDLVAHVPDFIGFIFYEESPRNAEEKLDAHLLLGFPPGIKKTGVFVDALPAFIRGKKIKYGLDYIQLHGNETPVYCAQLAAEKYQLIKAFSIDDHFDFGILKEYESYCQYFLFDTKGKNPGGNGQKFNWNILKTNPVYKPFFLSGGIGLDDISEIIQLKSEIINLYGIDVNSKFEISPGIKDLDKIKTLKHLLHANIDRF